MRNNSFFQRITFPTPPETLAEGLVKGLILGIIITSSLLHLKLIDFKPETAARVLRFYLALALIVGGWGFHNQQNQATNWPQNQPR